MSFLISSLDVTRKKLFSWLRMRTLGSSVLAVDDDDRVVLVRHTYGDRRWRLPGGGVRRGETFRQAALREVGEEIGLRPRDDAEVTLLGVYFRRRGNWVDHIAVHVVRRWDQVETKNWEIAETRRFPVGDLPSDISPAALRRISEWLGGEHPSEDW